MDELVSLARDVIEWRALEREVMDTSTREKGRIDHQLHDGLGQELRGLAFLTAILRNKLGDVLPEMGTLRTLAQDFKQGIQAAKRHIWPVIRGLAPVEMGGIGFVAALEQLAERPKGGSELTANPGAGHWLPWWIAIRRPSQSVSRKNQ